MANVRKPQQHHYTSNSLSWLMCTQIPLLHTDYFMYIVYKRCLHTLGTFCGEKNCTIIFALRPSLADWMMGSGLGCLAGCHSMCTAFLSVRPWTQARRECVQWLVCCGFTVFLVYLIARWNLIYVSKHRESNYYQCANVMTCCKRIYTGLKFICACQTCTEITPKKRIKAIKLIQRSAHRTIHRMIKYIDVDEANFNTGFKDLSEHF